MVGTGVLVGVVYCLFEGCSCQVNILQCTLEGVDVVGDKCIRIDESLFHGAIVRGKKLY